MNPSRRCCLCRRVEQPRADSVITSFWFCPTCAKKIQRQIYRDRMEVERRRYEKHLATKSP